MADPAFGGGNNNLTDRKLSWGLWFVSHREALKKIGYAFLIAVAVVSWGYTLWGVFDHFFLSGLDFERALNRDLATAANPHAPVIAKLLPRQLEIAEVSLVPSGSGRYDIAARVVNPNPKYLARVSYVLSVAGAESPVEETVLLPGRERWLTRLNVESAANPRTATLTFRSITWDRLSHLEVIDPKVFMDERLDIETRDAVFVPPQELVLGSGSSRSSGTAQANVSRATFTAVNRGAYGLRNLEFVVLLRRGTAIVAVNRIELETLAAGEARATAATWFHALGLIQSIEVYPYANVFDNRVFIAQ